MEASPRPDVQVKLPGQQRWHGVDTVLPTTQVARTRLARPGQAVTLRVTVKTQRRPRTAQVRLRLRASHAANRDAVTLVLRRR